MKVDRSCQAVNRTLIYFDCSRLPASACHLVKLRHKRCIKMLQHFEHATREISANKYLSVSKVIPLAQLLQRLTVECVSSCSTLKQKLLRSMAKRLTGLKSNYLLAVSMLLDPRFKKIGFGETSACYQAVQGLQWKWLVLFQQVVIMWLQPPNLWLHIQRKNRNHHHYGHSLII